MIIPLFQVDAFTENLFGGNPAAVCPLFNSRSGKLKVRKSNDLLTLDFPTDQIIKVENSAIFSELFSDVIEVWKGKTDYLLIFENQKKIEELSPDFFKLKNIEARGIIVSAPGDNCDFVSRFFAPQSGINEDPVTGSAHTTLMVYWSEKLNKKDLTAIQLSQRKGHIICSIEGERVKISGKCKTYLIGEIYLSE